MAATIPSRVKLRAHVVPIPSKPGGVRLVQASLTATSFSPMSGRFALAISHAIHLLVMVFLPTSTKRCVASLILRVRTALITPDDAVDRLIRPATVEIKVEIGVGVPCLQEPLVVDVFGMIVTDEYLGLGHGVGPAGAYF